MKHPRLQNPRGVRPAPIVWILAGAALAALAPAAEPGRAMERERFALEVEAGPLWQTRNAVRIPNETGTEFSLADAAGGGPWGVHRVEAGININDRHGFRAVWAPIDIEETAMFDTEVRFAGEDFEPGVETGANYKFSSYRFTYRYRFYDGPTWSWQVGGTAFIRDARIALRQGELSAEDTDVGFVPLAYLQGEARLGDRWRFHLDFEGLGAPQGRAFDLAARMGYGLSDHWELAFGYRAIEGGVDVDRVYNFAWLHLAMASLRFCY